MIKKGTWIEIVTEVLSQEERSNAIPQDTKQTPLIMWVKGHCLSDCEVGQDVQVETVTGRMLTGTVTLVEPAYTHDFGKYVPEIAYIGKQARELLAGE